MKIFLGGTAGHSTWRRDVAIPILEAANIRYYNPQLGVGQWTPAHQAIEAKEKAESNIWLFVVNGETRGVASLVEAAYRVGLGGMIALVVQDIGEDTLVDGQPLSSQERKDLNRGRSYLREVAEQHGIPVFDNVQAATNYAVELAVKGVWGGTF